MFGFYEQYEKQLSLKIITTPYYTKISYKNWKYVWNWLHRKKYISQQLIIFHSLYSTPRHHNHMSRQLVSRIWYESQHHSCHISIHPYIICSSICVHFKNPHKRINKYFYYFHKRFWDLLCSLIKFLLLSLKCYIVFHLIIIF